MITFARNSNGCSYVFKEESSMASMPAKPSGACVEMNIWAAKSQVGFVLGPMDFVWFFHQVRNKGPWDYKQYGAGYADFGNFNFGAVGYVIDIPEAMLL